MNQDQKTVTEHMIASEVADQLDRVPTMLSLGVIAYVGETLVHEGLGHGGICLLVGGHITILAPLWMRCSIDSPLVVAAGPVVNVLVSCLFLSMIWLKPPHKIGRAHV